MLTEDDAQVHAGSDRAVATGLPVRLRSVAVTENGIPRHHCSADSVSKVWHDPAIQREGY